MKSTGAAGEVQLITLDPGHFHAALVQKSMYPQVAQTVHVYAPEGQDVLDHLEKIKGFNQRAEDPTDWHSQVYTGANYLEQVLIDKPGNVVVLAGNNRKKAEYIKKCVAAGLNVLADKPMCIDREGFALLVEAFELAQQKGLLLYDIMTERFEITTILQKELAAIPEVFGRLQPGTPEKPAVVKESVHHLFKHVAGKPLKRPVWYFDTRQQGEGIVDVSTHLVDMVMWECFSEEVIGSDEIALQQAQRWPTLITQEQFQRVSGHDAFPDYLNDQLDEKGTLHCYCNGDMIFTIRGVCAKVSVTWVYQAPEGGGDTHYSVMRGSQAEVEIRQAQEENYQPKLYVRPADGAEAAPLEKALPRAVSVLQQKYPGIALSQQREDWRIDIPDRYRVGHEAHFGQVTENYLRYLVDGKLPDWEIPNMITKYDTTTQALDMARQS